MWRVMPLTRRLSTSILGLTLTIATILLAQTQAAPPFSLQDTPHTGLHRSGEDILPSYAFDEDAEQLLALKNHRASEHLRHASSLQQNDNHSQKLKGRSLAGQRLEQRKSTNNAGSRIYYHPNNLNQDKHQHESLSGVPHYTAQDLAEYIYKTGDEEGVSLALQELTQEGLMSSQEAVSYLYEIRNNLQYLRDQAVQNERKEAMVDIPNKSRSSMGLPDINENELLNSEIDNEIMLNQFRNQNAPTNILGDYSDDDYSMEEVIYQLAKLLFSQTQQKDGPDGSEKMMEKVVALVEQETQQGIITPEAHDKVLDGMMRSLVDGVKENELSASLIHTYGDMHQKSHSLDYPTFKTNNRLTTMENVEENKVINE